LFVLGRGVSRGQGERGVAAGPSTTVGENYDAKSKLAQYGKRGIGHRPRQDGEKEGQYLRKKRKKGEKNNTPSGCGA